MKSVLVVEDLLAYQVVLTQVLSQYGCTVHIANNGQEALDFLSSYTLPDLIILDLMMPVMDGRTFLMRREEDDRLRGIPVLIYSAEFSNREGNPRIKNVSGFISKTLPLSHAISIIRSVLEEKKGSLE